MIETKKAMQLNSVFFLLLFLFVAAFRRTGKSFLLMNYASLSLISMTYFLTHAKGSARFCWSVRQVLTLKTNLLFPSSVNCNHSIKSKTFLLWTKQVENTGRVPKVDGKVYPKRQTNSNG